MRMQLFASEDGKKETESTDRDIQLQQQIAGVKSAWVFVVQAVIIFIFGVFAYNLKYFFEPTIRGFFCGDRSLRFKYYDTTIEIRYVIGVAHVIFVTSLLFVEFLYANVNSKDIYYLSKLRVNIQSIRCIQFLLIFYLGFAMNLWLINVTKFTLGSLRPHFIDVCQPRLISNYNTSNNLNFTLENCPPLKFIEAHDYNCTNRENPTKLLDARLSFFSGHASISFYFATFIVLYVHCRIGRFEQNFLSLSILAYTVLVSVAAMVALSRLYDNKHHPIDVAIGSLIGIASAAILVYLYKNLFFDDSGHLRKPHSSANGAVSRRKADDALDDEEIGTQKSHF